MSQRCDVTAKEANHLELRSQNGVKITEANSPSITCLGQILRMWCVQLCMLHLKRLMDTNTIPIIPGKEDHMSQTSVQKYFSPLFGSPKIF